MGHIALRSPANFTPSPREVPFRAKRIRRLLVHPTFAGSGLLSSVRGLSVIIELPAFPPTGDVVRRLEELVEALDAHVRRTEASELYGWIPEALPECRDTLAALRREHTALMHRLKAVRDECDGAETIEISTPLSAKVRELMGELRVHEAREALVLHQALDAAQLP